MDFTPEVENEIMRESVSQKLDSLLVKRYVVSRDTGKLLMNGGGPICDKNQKPFNPGI